MWRKVIGITHSGLQSLLLVNVMIFETKLYALLFFVFSRQLCKIIKCEERSLGRNYFFWIAITARGQYDDHLLTNNGRNNIFHVILNIEGKGCKIIEIQS